MFENEEMWDGTYAIRATGAGGKIAGHVIVSTTNGVRTEDWYLITQAPQGGNYVPYIWPSSSDPDITYRFERTGGPGSPPNYGSGVSNVLYRSTPTQI